MTGQPSELRDLWPLYALRITIGDLELRYPTEAELPAFRGHHRGATRTAP